MSSIFEDRKKAHETNYAREMELEFRISARRNRLAGEWAAKRLGLTDAEADAYARQVIQADFEEPGNEDVIHKILGDLIKAGEDVSDIEIRDVLARCEDEARAQIKKES